MPAPPNFGTVNDVLNQAYANAGLIAEGQVLSSEKLATGFNRLNHLVNFLQTKGLKLFTNVDVPVPLVADQNLYQLRPGGDVDMTKPLRVVFAYYLDQYQSRVPMLAISWNEWVALPVENSAKSQPVNYFVDKQTAVLNVYVWPTPDLNAALGQVHLVLQTQIPLGTNLTESTYFPPEWFLGLAWALADELCIGQPAAIITRCAQKRAEFLDTLEGWDVEDAQTFFTVDSRTYHGGSFR